MSAYFEALEAHNDAHSPDAKAEPKTPDDIDKLRRFRAARKAVSDG